MTKRIWRKVVGHYSYSPTNNPHPSYDCSLIIQLECGHELPRKMAHGVPQKMACYDCEWKQKEKDGKQETNRDRQA